MNAESPIPLPEGADPNKWYDSDGCGPHGLDRVAEWCRGDPAAAEHFHMFRGPTYARYLELIATAATPPQNTTRKAG